MRTLFNSHQLTNLLISLRYRFEVDASLDFRSCFNNASELGVMLSGTLSQSLEKL